MNDSKDERIAELEEVARTLGYIKLEIPSFAGELLPPSSLHEKEDRVSSSFPVVVADASAVDITQSVQIASSEDRKSLGAPKPDLDHESDKTSNSLPPAVDQHIERLVSRLVREEMLHRKVLAFLVEHSPGAYSARQIAAWTNCPQELIEDDPPHGFLGSGLIVRERRTSGTLYRSALRAFVNREFRVFQPDIGDSGLHCITQLLRERLALIA